MAWLLALQAAARDDRDEQRAIERHLEPNEKACFRATMGELADDSSWLEALHLLARDTWPARASLTPATIVDPDEDEVAESPKSEPPSRERNGHRTIPRLAGTGWFRIGLVGLYSGAAIGAVLAALLFSERKGSVIFAPIVICMIASTTWFARRATRFVCGDRSCKEPLKKTMLVSPGCIATVAPTLTRRSCACELHLAGGPFTA
jgi:hypothetical protein